MRARPVFIALLAGVAGLAFAGAGSTGKLVTAQSRPHGSYVVDSTGRAVYLFTSDQRGQPDGSGASSRCKDACAKAWPPVLAQGQVQAGANVQQGLVGSAPRGDGGRQLTYGGWPLYYYAEDRGPGSARGHEAKAFGGDWALVNPSGNRVQTR